jgi:hypothetical protein
MHGRSPFRPHCGWRQGGPGSGARSRTKEHAWAGTTARTQNKKSSLPINIKSLGILYLIEKMTTLARFVEQLPPDIQKEIRSYAEFLLEKRSKKKQKVPAFDWEGALADLGEQYSSVELQHEIGKIRGA